MVTTRVLLMTVENTEMMEMMEVIDDDGDCEEDENERDAERR
jgi:hypothetical protein